MAITYTPSVNFGAKDSLPTNDPSKVIKGSEFTTEFTAIQTAFSLAAPVASPTFTGTVTIPTADVNGGNIDGTVIGAATPAAGSFTTGSFSGNVGIWTTSPNAPLTVQGGSATSPTIQLKGGSFGNDNASIQSLYNLTLKADSSEAIAGRTIGFAVGSTQAMTIDSSGNLTLNSNGSVAALDGVKGMQIGNTSVTNAGLALETNSRGYLMYINDSALSFWDSSDNSERMRLDASGNLLVGTASTLRSNKFHVAASNFVGGFNVTNGTGEAVAFFSNGTTVGSVAVTGTTTTYNTSSDARLKENIADADDASSLVDAIKVRQFDWKADGSHQRYGMVAQELLEVAPEAVSQGATEDDMMGVDYSKLVPMLVKEIQSLRARVAQLEGA